MRASIGFHLPTPLREKEVRQDPHIRVSAFGLEPLGVATSERKQHLPGRGDGKDISGGKVDSELPSRIEQAWIG